MAIRLEELVPQNKGPHMMGAAKNEKKVVYSSAIPIHSRHQRRLQSDRDSWPTLHKPLDCLTSYHKNSSDQMMAVGPVITHKKSSIIRISFGPKVKALGHYLAWKTAYSHSEGPLPSCLAITLQYSAGGARAGQIESRQIQQWIQSEPSEKGEQTGPLGHMSGS